MTISGLENENGRLTLRLKEIDDWRIKSGTFESALAVKSADYEKKITCLKNEIEKVLHYLIFLIVNGNNNNNPLRIDQ